MTTTTRLARTATMSERAAGSNRSVVGSAVVRLTAVLATVAGALVMLGLTAAPAQADYNPDAKYGYSKVIEPEAYLRYYVGQGVEVLNVDTEHMDVDGFWFAARSSVSQRGFVWQYQPFGMWCGGSILKVEFNGWMNTNRCGYDWDKANVEYPALQANTNTCRETSGHPWKTSDIYGGQFCANGLLDPGATGTFQEQGASYTCAPWEEQGLSATGTAKCLTQRYAFESAPVNSFWAPAPDTCTGLPADANKVPANPDSYVPAGPVPDCTGAPVAPNCFAGSTHQACTGAPQTAPVPNPTATTQWATSTITVTVNNGTATASATKVAAHKAVVYKAVETAKEKYNGKVYKAKKTVKVYDSATETVTTTATVTNGTATRTSTMTCSAATMVAAQECADAKAAAEANVAARAAAEVEASGRAQVLATQQAAEQAATAAERSVKESSVSASVKAQAAKQAKSMAVKTVKAKIKKAKARR